MQHGGSGESLNEEQMKWRRMIPDYIVSSFQVDRDDLDMAPFNSQGVMGQMSKPFGDMVDGMIEELDKGLAG